MSEPTPRQLRTDQLIDQARIEHNEMVATLALIADAMKLGGGRIGNDLLLNGLLEIAQHQRMATCRLMQAVENMAAAPCFNKEES
jgi:hypothetical protein